MAWRKRQRRQEWEATSWLKRRGSKKNPSQHLTQWGVVCYRKQETGVTEISLTLDRTTDWQRQALTITAAVSPSNARGWGWAWARAKTYLEREGKWLVQINTCNICDKTKSVHNSVWTLQAFDIVRYGWQNTIERYSPRILAMSQRKLGWYRVAKCLQPVSNLVEKKGNTWPYRAPPWTTHEAAF